MYFATSTSLNCGNSRSNAIECWRHGSVLANSGGVQGILDKLHAGGMSDIVSSWTAGGSCQSITTDQIKNALGNEHVQQIASQLGVSPDKALAALAEHLPGLASQQTRH